MFSKQRLDLLQKMVKIQNIHEQHLLIKKTRLAGKLLQKGESYLRRRSHVDNLSEVFPPICDTFAGY